MHNYRRWHGRDRRGLELSAVRIIVMSGVLAAGAIMLWSGHLFAL
jgi:hypothetical protein